LLDQVQIAAKDHDDQAMGVGLIVTVYNKWPHHRPRDDSFHAFCKRAGALIRAEVERAERFEIAKPARETLVPEGETRMGGATVQVGIAGQDVRFTR